MPRASPPDNSGLFVSRRDRPEHQQRRAGTGRQITSREFGVLGRHTGVKLHQTTKDCQGFDDLDQAWKSDNDDNQDYGTTLQNRSSLFPESPMSVSTVLNEVEPEPEISGKRLEFNSGQNDGEDSIDDFDSRTPSDSEPFSGNDSQPIQSKPSKFNYDATEGRVKKSDKSSRKEKVAKSPTELAVKNNSSKNTKKSKRKPISRSSIASISSGNDENQRPIQIDDSGTLTQTPSSSPVIFLKKSSSSYKQMKTSTKSAPVKKKRRQTLLIIDEAQESGIIDDDNIVIENDKIVRRSQRARCRPVNFFECEQPNYIRGPGGLFSLDRDKVVIKHVPTPPPPPSRRSRHKRRRPKAQDDSSDEIDDLLPLSGETKIIGPNGKERRQIVAFRASDLNAVKLATKPPAGENVQEKDLTPSICKFDGLDGVSAGILSIPAGGTKYLETVSRTEVFFIASCECNSLLFKVNNHEFKLSSGDTFTVPLKNSYSIHNVSRHKAAKIFFSSVRT